MSSFNPEIIDSQMVKIPGGSIVLRDDRLKHSWEVQIKPFLLSRYLITRELYALVAGENPYTLADPNKPVDSVT